MYAIQDVPGRGQGLVAIENIPAGTRILCEEPIISAHEDFDLGQLQRHIPAQVKSLDEKLRQDFMSMHNIHPYKTVAERYAGIFRTNALPYSDNEIGIFLQACRINHACDNNAQKSWNVNIKRHTVHALTAIKKGEEITITYLKFPWSREVRQEKLWTGFKFKCTCRLCALPPDQSAEMDKTLKATYDLDALIGQGGLHGILSSPLQKLRYVDSLVSLYNKLGSNDIGLPRALLDAAQIAIAHGDLARGRIFAERAVSGWRLALGSDSTQVVDFEPIAADPRKLSDLYGLSKKWNTQVNEVPNGLDPSDFEDWLWRRAKPASQGQFANLRDRESFPGFTDLPDKPSFLHYGMAAERPQRHWCFFAEIVEKNFLFRMLLNLRDVDGKQIPLFFYTDGRGRELPPAQVQQGYTVAILYPRRHYFQAGEIGIRHEEPKNIKVRNNTHFSVHIRYLLLTSDHSHLCRSSQFP